MLKMLDSVGRRSSIPIKIDAHLQQEKFSQPEARLMGVKRRIRESSLAPLQTRAGPEWEHTNQVREPSSRASSSAL